MAHLDVDCPERMAGALYYQLSQLSDQGGHTCYPQDKLCAETAKFLYQATPEVSYACGRPTPQRASGSTSLFIPPGDVTSQGELSSMCTGGTRALARSRL